jgi:hypothetical protein
MGEAKRRKVGFESEEWPRCESFRGTIQLDMLSPAPAINGARIRELTGDEQIPDTTQIMLQAFRAVVGPNTFHVGFCLGDGEEFSAIGIGVIERLMMEESDSKLHVVAIVHEEIAWDIVLRHLRTFSGKTLLFAFVNSDVYDAGTAEMFYSTHVTVCMDGGRTVQLTDADRRQIREKKASLLGRSPPPRFYAATGIDREEKPWIFEFVSPTGKAIRVAAWNGRRNYAHEFPPNIIEWVGGKKIAIVQVDKPVGVDRRSALGLTNFLSKDFDGIIHWARDTETFQSIIKSFVRLDLPSVSPPDVPEGWNPEITMLGANGP